MKIKQHNEEAFIKMKIIIQTKYNNGANKVEFKFCK